MKPWQVPRGSEVSGATGIHRGNLWRRSLLLASTHHTSTAAPVLRRRRCSLRRLHPRASPVEGAGPSSSKRGTLPPAARTHAELVSACLSSSTFSAHSSCSHMKSVSIPKTLVSELVETLGRCACSWLCAFLPVASGVLRRCLYDFSNPVCFSVGAPVLDRFRGSPLRAAIVVSAVPVCSAPAALPPCLLCVCAVRARVSAVQPQWCAAVLIGAAAEWQNPARLHAPDRPPNKRAYETTGRSAGQRDDPPL